MLEGVYLSKLSGYRLGAAPAADCAENQEGRHPGTVRTHNSENSENSENTGSENSENTRVLDLSLAWTLSSALDAAEDGLRW